MENQKKKFMQMQRDCAFFRGSFIHYMTIMEMVIDNTLIEYFCPDSDERQMELRLVLFDTEKSTLAQKYKMLSFIFQRHYNEFNEKYNFKPKNKKRKKYHEDSLDKKVADLIELRNIFAHRKLYIGENSVANYDGKALYLDALVASKGELIPDKLLLNDEFNKIHSERIAEVNNILFELYQLVSKKRKGDQEAVPPSQAD